MRATGENTDAAPQTATNGFTTLPHLRTSSTTRPHSSRIRPAPATVVLAGTVPDPLLSSRARGWHGLTV
ncbi:MAG TPA: hypothetical protein VLI21_01425, partial [Casimicrobiaceae bacterium]|nr:hypothetical protein [Casimicrobiaceae bacterium]